MSDVAEFCYKVTYYYHPNDEAGIAWNDNTIGIKWPEVVGRFQGNANPVGYKFSNGLTLVMSKKDKAWDFFNGDRR